MPDIDLKIIKKELYNGYSNHNECRETIVNLIQNGISEFILRYNRIEQVGLFSHTTFEFIFYYKKDNIEKEMYFINCKYSRKTLNSFLEVLNYIMNNYEINLTNEFLNDGYFYDETQEEIVRYIYK